MKSSKKPPYKQKAMIKAEDQTLKAEDLRIGNLVKTYSSPDVYTVKAIKHDEDNYDGYFIEFEHGTAVIHNGAYNVVEGIPLNEEWLIKLGFCRSKHGWYEITPFARFNIEPTDTGAFMICSGCKCDDGGESNLLTIIYYVHQLQNIWASCNLGELTIKP